MSELEYFSLFSGYYSTEKAGYRIYWFHSSEKKKNDHLRRGHRLEKAERALLNLMLRLNKRKLKTREEIEAQIEKILKKHKVNSFYEISLTAYYR